MSEKCVPIRHPFHPVKKCKKKPELHASAGEKSWNYGSQGVGNLPNIGDNGKDYVIICREAESVRILECVMDLQQFVLVNWIL